MFSLHHDKYIDAELKKEQYFSFFVYVALKVHKIEIFLASILKFVLFLC
jgi:hypothetical protein